MQTSAKKLHNKTGLPKNASFIHAGQYINSIDKNENGSYNLYYANGRLAIVSADTKIDVIEIK